jgi:peptidoglycan lytic transglycosylase
MSKFLIRFLCLFQAALLSFSAVSQTKTLYIQAKKALNRGNLEKYHELKSQLLGHPLEPYLDYYHILKTYNQTNDAKILKFIDKHPKSPMSSSLRRKLLIKYAKTNQWQKYIDLYQPSKNITKKCIYLTALDNTGQLSKGFEDVKSIWLTGKDRPKECQQVLSSWLDKSKIKDALVWQRFELALKRYNFKLVNRLIPKFSANKQRQAKTIIRLYKHPYLVTKNSFIKNQSSAEVVSYGIFRVARRNPELAIKTFKNLDKKYHFNKKQKKRMFQAIALRFALNKNKKSSIWFRKVIGHKLDPVYQEWMIRSALIHRDWLLVKDGIEGMPKELRENIRWQYWRARALDKLGMKEQAEIAYKNIAGKRDYHGFLASKHTKKILKVKHNIPEIDEKELSKVKSMPGFIRAKHFYQLNQKTNARRELYYLIKHTTIKEQYIIMKLVYDWGWKVESLRLSRFAKHKDDINLRFPLKYHETVMQHAKKYKVPPALIYAIIRQESFFTERAKSHAGAMGLMQLMPKTAYKTSKQFSFKYSGTKTLFDGKTNIKFGSAHLKKLHEQLDNHPVLVVAAYNAGREAVNRWTPKTKEIPADIWVETIPYYETRKYIRHVIAYYVVYQKRLGKSPNLENVMFNIK